MLADAFPFDEEKRHACEVSWVMRTMYHDEQRTDEYFKLVEKKRNKGAADKLRHTCDVSWVMDTIYPDGKRAAEHFVRLEKKRGKEATDKLRESCREKWKTWKIADSIVGQA